MRINYFELLLLFVHSPGSTGHHCS